LTASLSEQEKHALLGRMQPNVLVTTNGKMKNEQGNYLEKEEEEEEEEEDEEETRGSVQEEIALAVREETRKNEQQWSQEKERITQQLEAAAEARIKTELQVQQKRLEQERDEWKKQTQLSNEKAMKTLQQKIESLETELEVAVKAKKQMKEASEKAIQQAKANLVSQQQQQDQFVSQKDELEQVEAMLKKRKEQQGMLEKVEIDLREKTIKIKEQKDELIKMQQQQKLLLESIDDNSPMQESNDTVLHLSPKEYRSLSKQEKVKLKDLRQAAKETTTPGQDDYDKSSEEHPVLGPVVADLGYKRIHLVSSGQLGTIPIWKRQRTYRNDRARRMALEKQSTMHLGFPGIVCLYEDNKGGLSILDGQHRVGMMQALCEMRNKDSNSDIDREKYFKNVLVEVYSDISQDRPASTIPSKTSNNKTIAEQLFVEINKAEPVKLVDIPGVASAADRKLITEAVETLQLQFPQMFSTSQRCRAPNVNIDNLRNSIYGANILQRHQDQITTSASLVNWLLEQNAAIGEMYERDVTKQNFLSPKAWTKASTNGFYLGLEGSWLFV
jgi:hypothetical protein